MKRREKFARAGPRPFGEAHTMQPEYGWEPLSPPDAAATLQVIEAPFWIAGGVAIDLFLGRETRAHGDLDVAMLRRDVRALTKLARDWDVHIAHDGTLTPWDGTALAPEVHQFWVRRHGAETWAFEVLLEESHGDTWSYRRDPRVTRSLSRFGVRATDRPPYLRPEITLLYKSNRPETERNAHDFEIALPHVDPLSREWLRRALGVIDRVHPWIPRLDGQAR
jgi:hypothetical protein